MRLVNKIELLQLNRLPKFVKLNIKTNYMFHLYLFVQALLERHLESWKL